MSLSHWPIPNQVLGRAQPARRPCPRRPGSPRGGTTRVRRWVRVRGWVAGGRSVEQRAQRRGWPLVQAFAQSAVLFSLEFRSCRTPEGARPLFSGAMPVVTFYRTRTDTRTSEPRRLPPEGLPAFTTDSSFRQTLFGIQFFVLAPRPSYGVIFVDHRILFVWRELLMFWGAPLDGRTLDRGRIGKR